MINENSQKDAIFVNFAWCFLLEKWYLYEIAGATTMRASIQVMVKDRIIKQGRGWCFTSMDFWDLGSDDSIRKTLSLLSKQRMIRRLAQGVYDYPKFHEVLGEIPPDLTEVAKAIAEKNGVKIQPAGAYAANLLGFTTQVPGQIVFLTEGPSRKIKISDQEIILKKTSKKVMASAGTREGLLIQALKNIGKDHVDAVIQTRIAKFLKKSTEKEIKQNIKFAPAWIRALVFEIMGLKS